MYYCFICIHHRLFLLFVIFVLFHAYVGIGFIKMSVRIYRLGLPQ